MTRRIFTSQYSRNTSYSAHSYRFHPIQSDRLLLEELGTSAEGQESPDGNAGGVSLTFNAPASHSSSAYDRQDRRISNDRRDQTSSQQIPVESISKSAGTAGLNLAAPHYNPAHRKSWYERWPDWGIGQYPLPGARS